MEIQVKNLLQKLNCLDSGHWGDWILKLNESDKGPTHVCCVCCGVSDISAWTAKYLAKLIKCKTFYKN